jgi:hypothetical protein
MNGDDWQALREIDRHTRMLLSYAEVLPEGLAAMLRSYASELAGVQAGLDSESSRRWKRAGGLAARDALASRMGRSIADGEWPAGKRLGWPPDAWYCAYERGETILGALQLLALRGELAVRCGTYYVEVT